MKKMRAIITLDLEIDGDFSLVGEVEQAVKGCCERLKENLVIPYEYTEHENCVKITQTQAALTDRRGKETGPVEKMVFRN